VIRAVRSPIARQAGPAFGVACLGLYLGVNGWAADPKASQADREEPPGPNLPESLKATSAAREPLNLLLTQAELRLLISGYESRTGVILTAPIDDEEVVVTAPGDRVPMRDASQDVMGGIAAPFWAIAHPKDAWRIFVPIPPRERPQMDERPAPDPR
jgi:hypothetical protein